ncbi:MAG: ankyrin repeat domain-containing protein [Pseudomonadota bacterium]|nr:ankyrin repeat domain-containing protein [Sphingomonas sp.]MDQ3471135.1 ankyrin repeat domain-containing protein [Pseudomonadota bacterium]
MSWLTRLMTAMVVATIAAAAPAQGVGGTDGEKFVSMVRKGDGNGALALLESKPVLVNAIDGRGDTALLVAVKGRDSAWTGHLIQAGADPNLAARNGDTPLIVAARSRFTEAAGWLLGDGAKIDAANKMGETALIIAVQQRQLPLVKLLLAAGADPDHTDSAAGLSARDYAKRETRFPELFAAIEAGKGAAAKPAKPASDKLDDFKLD